MFAFLEADVPETAQNYSNHRKLIPLYHGGVTLVLVVYFGRAVSLVWQAPGFDTILGVFVAAALILLIFYPRSFALTVQDRVIRLEMRLRMKEVLPASLHARIPDFTPGQLVALRFASDAELPALAAKVLAEKLEDKNAIKKMIKEWQGDYLRA